MYYIHPNYYRSGVSADSGEICVTKETEVTHRFHKAQVYRVKLLQRSCSVGRVDERFGRF